MSDAMKAKKIFCCNYVEGEFLGRNVYYSYRLAHNTSQFFAVEGD